MNQIKVNFLKEKDSEDVFAYFPEIKNGYDVGVNTCYAHIGQHSACHKDYAKECKEANYNEYADLLRELIGQGYTNLKIINKQVLTAHRPPTKGEIKFGEGATHYKDFILADMLTKKGDLKIWFICPIDKLRYSRL